MIVDEIERLMRDDAHINQASYEVIASATAKVLRDSHKIEPLGFETPKDLLARAHTFLDFLRSFMQSSEWKLVGGPNAKIGVVTHSVLVSAVTAKGLDATNHRGFLNATDVENVQLLPILV